MLTIFGVLVHGYHPYAEDGGLYVAGIKKLLNPALYPRWTEFVTEHLRYSLFAPVVAGLVRASHLSLGVVLLMLYCVSLWMTLYAGWMLACCFTTNLQARLGAVALVTCWITLPIAGTSLMLMDSYVTARSFSTPLVLMAIASSLDVISLAGAQRVKLAVVCAAWIATAAVLHPLMAGYGLGAVLVILCVGAKSELTRKWGPVALLLCAVGAAWLIQAKAPAESGAYVQAALTRYYWFPFAWAWYEQLGLLAPLAVLLSFAKRNDSAVSTLMARSGIWLGVIALGVALLFSRQHLATHMVARLQPLRAFQLVYELMILLLGAWLGQHILKARVWLWATLLAGLGAGMFSVQRSVFPNSSHLEWPWSEPVNPWEQAFVWARENTPVDALFALDARYIERGRQEDAQCFRAIAERSSLPDYSKDGGEASITPELTEAWMEGQAAQTGLEGETDSERASKLRPFEVGWVVLEASSVTNWSCPYANHAVKVCRVPRGPEG